MEFFLSEFCNTISLRKKKREKKSNMSTALQNQLFNLKFTSKQLQRLHKKCEKNEKLNKGKVAQAISKGNMDGAKIYAENAIREKNQGLNYLRLASRLDAVGARLETAIRMRQVTGSMSTIVNSLEKASKSMNLEQLTMTMDKFEKAFEDLDVQGQYAGETMNRVSSSSVPTRRSRFTDRRSQCSSWIRSPCSTLQ